jgi:antitoxin VapB
MNEHAQFDKDADGITVSIFNNGRSRAIRIPKEFEFASKTVIMNKQPDGSILMRAGETAGLVDYLKTAEPWRGEPFLADDEDLAPLDEIDLP